GQGPKGEPGISLTIYRLSPDGGRLQKVSTTFHRSAEQPPVPMMPPGYLGRPFGGGNPLGPNFNQYYQVQPYNLTTPPSVVEPTAPAPVKPSVKPAPTRAPAKPNNKP